jgi:hypothetical protein
MNISRQIGWSNESNLLYQILKQLTKLTGVIFNLTPKYKVYTALLSQSGGDNSQILSNSALTVGVTYEIYSTDSDTVDFTNVGAPNNDLYTSFVATGTTPNSWGTNQNGELRFNAGAPVVTVLENTIGNIWFTYDEVGYYSVNSNDLYTTNKTGVYLNSVDFTGSYEVYPASTNNITIGTADSNRTESDNYLSNSFIEIRVYN